MSIHDAAPEKQARSPIRRKIWLLAPLTLLLAWALAVAWLGPLTGTEIEARAIELLKAVALRALAFTLFCFVVGLVAFPFFGLVSLPEYRRGVPARWTLESKGFGKIDIKTASRIGPLANKMPPRDELATVPGWKDDAETLIEFASILARQRTETMTKNQ